MRFITQIRARMLELGRVHSLPHIRDLFYVLPFLEYKLPWAWHMVATQDPFIEGISDNVNE